MGWGEVLWVAAGVAVGGGGGQGGCGGYGGSGVEIRWVVVTVRWRGGDETGGGWLESFAREVAALDFGRNLARNYGVAPENLMRGDVLPVRWDKTVVVVLIEVRVSEYE
ncbi:hypothetical protein Tco_1355802 [Tanacetum coccineum]